MLEKIISLSEVSLIDFLGVANANITLLINAFPQSKIIARGEQLTVRGSNDQIALVEAIVRDEKKIMACCVPLDGEYNQKDICLGVPVILGKNGWEKIVDYQLTEEEQTTFNKSADAVRNMNAVLETLSL